LLNRKNVKLQEEKKEKALRKSFGYKMNQKKIVSNRMLDELQSAQTFF
jgi:ribosomal protein S25